MDDRIRKKVFYEELRSLHDEQYISLDDYIKIKKAHQKYYFDQNQNIETREQSIPVEVKPKKVLSPQEIRDRNITWVLIAGVLMVLIAGLVLATSNWDSLNNIVKTTGIILVSLLFFGISWVTSEKLKIEKTGFAFWTLGSLFLPVTFLSIGFFELFGEYLSVTGRGKYLLGILASVVCLPVYFYSAKRYENKLFVWIAFTTMSLGIGFLLASFYPTVDVFYLGMIIYNTLLLAGYLRFKNSEKNKLFVQELPLFTQANLIISTLLMLSFFKSPLFYGFNIILTAILYILMVYAQGKKEYIYVFGGLLVYGIYQITENSILGSMDLVVFALIGFIFLGLEKCLKNDDNQRQIFHIISGVVSFCAFLYISAEGMIIRTENPSLLLFISYILIAINYIYLAYKTERLVFSYLAPIFLVAAGYQSFKLTENYYHGFDGSSIHLYGIGVLIFFGLFVFNTNKFLQPIKNSSLAVAMGTIIVAIGLGWTNEQWALLSLMLFVLGLAGATLHKVTENKELKVVGKWLIPISWYFALLAFYPKLLLTPYELRYSQWLVMAAVLIMAINEVLVHLKRQELAEGFLYCSNGALIYALGFMIVNVVDEPSLFVACLLVYLYSIYRSTNELMVKFSLYGAFTVFSFTLVTIIYHYKIQNIDLSYIFPFVTGLILLLWYGTSDNWRKRIMLYLIPYSFLGAVVSNFADYSFEWTELLIGLVSIALALCVVKLSGMVVLNIFPLFVLIWAINSVYSTELSSLEITLIYIVVIFAIKTVGEKFQSTLYKSAEDDSAETYKTIDWYAIATLILIFNLFDLYPEKWYLEVIPYLLLPYLLYSQINRVKVGFPKRIAKTLAAGSLLLPYYYVLDKIKIPTLIEMELSVLPWILIVVGLSKKVWSDKNEVIKKVELGVLIAVFGILTADAVGKNDPYEGILLGGISLVSVIAGMQFKKKSFFFVGLGTLVLNVLYMSKGFWGNMPWWVYLLAAGLILIGVASVNEMEKGGKGKNVFKNVKENFLKKFTNWS